MKIEKNYKQLYLQIPLNVHAELLELQKFYTKSSKEGKKPTLQEAIYQGIVEYVSELRKSKKLD